MKTIELSQGRFAQVDDCDHEWLSQWKWLFTNTGCYAIRYEGRKLVLMHREINKTPAGLTTDHKDGNGLNNQRNNLRTATHSENMRNRKVKDGKLKGIYFKKDRGKYAAQLRVNKTKKHLGYYDNPIDAAKAYNLAAIKYHGEFARLNTL